MDYTVVRIHLIAHWIGLALASGVVFHYSFPFIKAFATRGNLGLMEVLYGIAFLIFFFLVVYSIPRFVGSVIAIFFTPRSPE